MAMGFRFSIHKPPKLTFRTRAASSDLKIHRSSVPFLDAGRSPALADRKTEKRGDSRASAIENHELG